MLYRDGGLTAVPFLRRRQHSRMVSFPLWCRCDITIQFHHADAALFPESDARLPNQLLCDFRSQWCDGHRCVYQSSQASNRSPLHQDQPIAVHLWFSYPDTPIGYLLLQNSGLGLLAFSLGHVFHWSYNGTGSSTNSQLHEFDA